MVNNVHPTMKRKLSDPGPCGAQVRAQRKFAQGVLLSNAEAHLGKRTSDSCTPSPPPVASKPKTEDFINFLCYRGTPALPPSLTFFNYTSTREEELKAKRINEQEAKFAMTALKLKYQEKRLSIVSTLAKKVKERRVILARPRIGRNGPAEEVKLKSAAKPIDKKPNEAEIRARNAPSPDIIDGVHHNHHMTPAKVEPKRESAAEKKQTEPVKPKKAKTCPEVQVRMSRLEKTSTPSSNTKVVAAKPKFLPSRVTTRALRKENSSPLHELPMRKPSPKPPQKEKERPIDKKTERYSRPTRKTKENATIYLGLINKDFSSDDEMPDMPKEEDDSASDSSSSETKFLEKQYNASLKRDETNKMQNAKDRQKKLDRQKKKKEKAKEKEKEKQEKKASKPEKRVLRSHSNSSISIVQTSRYSSLRSRRGSESEIIERRLSGAGAARKSAIAARGKLSKQSSSSSSESSSSEEESEGESEAEKCHKSEEEDDPVKGVSDQSDDDEDEEERSAKEEESGAEGTDEGSDSEEEEVREIAVAETDGVDRDEESEEEEEEEVRNSPTKKRANESFSDGELSRDVVVEKVSIAIQVDMDLDEEAEPLAPSAQVHQFQPHQTPQTSISVNAGTSSSSSSRRSPPQIPLFSHLNLQPSNNQPQGHQQQHELPSHSSHMPMPMPNLTIPRPIIPEIQVPQPPPPTTLMSDVLHQHCSISSTMEPPTVLSFNSMTSFSPFHTISHPMLPFGCVTETASTSLDTHIRTVAANLDIRLVRPSMAPSGSLATFPFTNSLSLPSLPSLPFAKPMSLMPDPSTLPFYSGFRAPFSTYTARPFTPMAAAYQTVHTTAIHTTHHTPMPTMMNLNLQPQPQPQPQPPLRPVHVHTQGQGQDLSLIQHLPNVSIVPRFDRNSKVVILPNATRKPVSSQPPPTSSNGHAANAKPSTSASSNINSNRSSNAAAGDKSKKKSANGNGSGGRKPKSSLPPPSSPLTVRKDSITPATYSASGSRKNGPSTSTSRKK